MAKILISDTADVVMRRKSDGKTIFTAEAQTAGITQDISETDVRGGIGNKKIAVIRSDKSIKLKTKMALFDLEYLSVTQGVAVVNGSANVFKTEENLLVVDAAGILSVTVTGTPIDNKVTLTNLKGVSQEFTVTTKKATVLAAFAAAGEAVSALYKEAVTGNIVSLDSKKFSENYEVEYHTIAYNPSTNQVVSDIYFQFDNCLPAGAFDISLENGNALSPALDFEALAALNSSEIGRVIEIPRVVTP
jgi:hypothetical protein